ncbi:MULTISPECIES: SWIM zinc finger family protein [Streptomyces]|uniref:SWIM zinc finger family protein n=1 Tax=Streptomyces TaxID=1883 RepID=UPI00163D32AE|nr:MULTISPECIES: SWIM zinc finger family protein [Streptomyces]MBC2874778.1 SWIM zinc finger family protein [Streptomyces sp. TYQ1024]UBI37232.1 SWIM zinc finger domain-containing protein [Streptomyces mobaraensis]UKW29824.1 SWIM zinc finger domain-containing protein [Streptomyces sp. TYQ1024]
MNPQGEHRTADQTLAPPRDSASRTAGGRLATPGSWSGTGARPDAVWGECAGGGGRTYRTVVDTSDANRPSCACSCSSREVPCKHAVGLLLLWAAGHESVRPAEEPPPWAHEWLEGRRRRRASPSAVRPPAASAPSDRRAANRALRIAEGAEELERRLADLVHGGLAGSGGGAREEWDRAAARMVDAQAPGLAAVARELGSLPAAGPDWASRLLEECALLHTLNRAYARVDRLPAGLAATVRARVGITVDSAALSASAPPVRDEWLVLSQDDTSDDNSLITRRIRLQGRHTGRAALLLSYGAAGRTPGLSLPVGFSLDADLVFHPAAVPLRAVLGTRHGDPEPAAGPPPGVGVEAALAAYGTALRDDPWLDAWPVVLDGVVPLPDPDIGRRLADAEGDAALAVDARRTDESGWWRLVAVAAGRPVRVFGECGHRGFAPLAVWAPELISLRR